MLEIADGTPKWTGMDGASEQLNDAGERLPQ